MSILESLWAVLCGIFGSKLVADYLFPTLGTFYFGYVIFNLTEFFSIRRQAEKVLKDAANKMPGFEGDIIAEAQAHSLGVIDELSSLGDDFLVRGHSNASFGLLEAGGAYGKQLIEHIVEYHKRNPEPHELPRTLREFVSERTVLLVIIKHRYEIRKLRPSWFSIYGGHWLVTETKIGSRMKAIWWQFRAYLRGTGEWR